MFFRKKIEECGIRNGKMTENKKIKIGIISDTHGLLRTEVLDILQSCDCIFHAGDVDRPDRKSTRLNSSHSRASRMPSSA